MANRLPSVATAEVLRAIAERSLEVLDLLQERDEDEEGLDEDHEEQDHVAFRAAKEGLRFAAAAAGQLGDADLVSVLVRALRAMDEWDNHAEDDTGAIAAGLTALLRASGVVPLEAEELAADPKPAVRVIAAAGLRATSAEAVSLLEKLAIDPAVDVRTPAKEALATVRELPWWQGKFSSDPLARLTAAEAAAHGEALEKLSAVLDQPRYRLCNADEEIAALLATLPDALAVDGAQMVLAGGDRHDRLLQVGALMVSRRGGAEALIELCKLWAKRSFYRADEEAKMVIAAPPPAREAVCVALARWAAAQPRSARCAMDRAAALAAQIAGRAFPPSGDLRPILELLTAAEPEDEDDLELDLDWVAAGLNDAFSVPGVDPTPIADELIAARLAGYTGRWHALRTTVDKLLARLPKERLRATAEAAIHAGGPHAEATIAWGLERLLFEAHDPERDPEPPDQVRRFLGEPRLRAVLLDGWEVRLTAVAPMREALRAGELELAEAAFTVGLLSDLWGGRSAQSLAGAHRRVKRDGVDHEATMREARLVRYAAFLGPAELRGPVTDAEWAALRRARDRHRTWDLKAWTVALGALPEGAPWHPEDRALLARAVAAFEGGLALDYGIAVALAAKPEVDDLPIFHKLARLCDRDSRSLIRSLYRTAREALGLPASFVPPGADQPAAREWMDEEDEEDEDEDEDEDDDEEDEDD